MIANFQSTFYSIKWHQVGNFFLPFSQMRKLTSQGSEGAMAWVSGSIPRHVRAGRAFFISLSAVSAYSLVDAIAPLLWQQPSSPRVSACFLCNTALCPFKGPVLLHGSCSQGVQCTEVTGNLFLSPTTPITLVYHSLLFQVHREAQGHGRSRSQGMQAKSGLRRQLEANVITWNL